VTSMPTAIGVIASNFQMQGGQYGPSTVVLLTASFIAVVAGAVVITQGQRRIPIQQAKHTRGRRVYGGQRMYLPLRVNHGGVMPIIFASSLMMFPSIFVGWMHSLYPNSAVWNWVDRNIQMNAYPHVLIYI